MGQVLRGKLRFTSGEVSGFGDNVAWTQHIAHSLEKSHDIFCWGGFCCCLGSGVFCWWGFFLPVSFGTSFFELPEKTAHQSTLLNVSVDVFRLSTCLQLV